MEIKKYALVKALENVQNDIQEMRNDFIKEYGTDNINIQDGTISYPPENPNPEGNGETDKKD